MDIYGADAHLQKVIEFLKEFSQMNSNTNLYAPTKARLSQLSSKAQSIVSLIMEVLQDEIMEDSEVEFSETTSSNVEVAEFIRCIESELSKFKSFAQSGNTNLKLANKSNTVTSEMRKRVMSEYATAFKQVYNAGSSYQSVGDCASLLWRWFNTRFFVTISSHPDFKYNIRRIAAWTRDIVILYGNALSQGTQDSFIFEFVQWCESLNNSEVGDKFAVPYNVYQFEKSADAKVSLTSVVLWDILVSLGLHNICTDDVSDLYLSTDAVYTLCEQRCPDELDMYVNFADDPSIVRRCNIN